MLIANNWKLKSQSIVDYLNKLWHNHKREPHVVIKKNEVGLCEVIRKAVEVNSKVRLVYCVSLCNARVCVCAPFTLHVSVMFAVL